MIVKSDVQKFVKERGVKTSEEVYAVLAQDIQTKLTEAIKRAQANGRKTLYARDL